MVLACSHSRSLQLLARLDARTEFKILEHSLKGGVEAGRAHHCIQWGVISVRAQATPNVIFLLNYYIVAIKLILEL
jgi:hypothetical protein